eukprot:5909943-Prymnesium_polylepis.1
MVCVQPSSDARQAATADSSLEEQHTSGECTERTHLEHRRTKLRAFVWKETGRTAARRRNPFSCPVSGS